MKPDLERWMTDALRFTQGGDLQAATQAIQAALGHSSATAPFTARQPDDRGDVIDMPGQEPLSPDSQPVGGDSFGAGRFVGAGLVRDYKLYLPPDTAATPRPLLLMLHGCTQTPDDFAAGTRMNEAARERGFAVLYPEQSAQANPQRCWNWFKPQHQRRGRGEPAFLAALVQQVLRDHALDPRRVYAAGLSAGGAMAALLGREYPDLFAAIGVHSGLAAGAARDMESAFSAMRQGARRDAAGAGESARPTIVFHGGADPTVNFRNAEQVAAAARPPGAAAESRPWPAGVGRSGSRQLWRDAQGRVRTELWRIEGAGHAWSGGSARGSHADPLGPDASDEMLRFFLEHQQPQAQPVA